MSFSPSPSHDRGTGVATLLTLCMVPFLGRLEETVVVSLRTAPIKTGTL